MKKNLFFFIALLCSIFMYSQCTTCNHNLSGNSNNYNFLPGTTCVKGAVTLENEVTFSQKAVVCIPSNSVLTLNSVNQFKFLSTDEITINIFGTLDINGNPRFSQNIHFNIHPGGKLTSGNMIFEGSSSRITNHGTTSVSNLELGNGNTLTIENFKKMKVLGNMNFATGTSFVRNQGELSVTSSFSTGKNSVYSNCGDFQGQFNLGGGKVINTGNFISSQIDMGENSHARFDNYGNVKLLGNLNMGGLNSVFYNEGIVDASNNGNIQSDGDMTGPTSGKGYFLLASKVTMNNGKIGPNLNFTIKGLGKSTIKSSVFNNSLSVQSSVTFGEDLPSLKAVKCPNIDGSFPANITANDDKFTIVAGSNSPSSVLQNDDIDGVQASTSNIVISEVSSTHPGVTINTSTGIINVASATPPGTYQLVYRICDIKDKNKCDTATVTITVTALAASGACYKPAATSGTSLETHHGITALSRAGSEAENDNWPMQRNGAWIILESKTKGFVINRVKKTSGLANIKNPIEAMMVYDEEANCLKIFTIKQGESSAKWHCLTTQACPD
ncbi:Ig-like domain-containing protein [Chryseobacterium sp. T1]